jgi:diguanylate cyclase (GGDEF)-like protein
MQMMIFIVGILSATTLLSGHLAIYLAAHNRGSRSVIDMALVMSASAWWAAWNALEYLAPNLSTKLVFANLQYPAIAAISVLWFSFGFSLEREERTGAARNPPLVFWIVPLITAILVWTDPFLGLVRHSFRLETHSGITVIAKEFGPWFWVHSAYSYVLIIVGTVLILKGLNASRGTRKAQRVTLVVGALLPTAANLLYISGLFPPGSVDPTPLAFSLMGLLLVLNLARFRFLALVTTAHAIAIEQLRDAVLILDHDGNLAYMNAAARSCLGIGAMDVGKRVREMGPPFSELSFQGAEVGPNELAEEAELSYGQRRYETRSSGIVRGGRRIGHVVTFFDVTRRVTAEESLKEANRTLEQGIADRTKALEESNQRLREELDHRKRVEKQLSHDVLHDALTGLANRSLALGRIEQLMLRSRRDPALSYGILYLDIDRFRGINDTFGRNAGDSFLCEVSARLKRSVREVDLVARVGGDEFVVLLDGFGTTENFEEITDRVADALSVPVSFVHNTVIPSAGIGILIGRPDFKDPEQVLHDAEIAMHKAKSAGRNIRAVFSEDMRLQVDERNLLSTALRMAIASGGISLVYQPIVRMDGFPIGWEVLARWRHEQLGPISPDRFIPLAEESGLIIPLGTYILIETLKTAVSLRDAGLLDDRGTRFFSVNVSAIQLGQSDFADLVLSSIERFGLPHEILHLELTESAIMENRDAVTHVIERLSAEGIGFKLDDFGKGYSSLAYLHHIPIDCVKIDRSFIARMDAPLSGEEASAGIVRGMISLSHDLRKTVVAEGIETEAQARMLKDFGCDYAQGYLFGKPVDGAALAESLKRGGV